MSGRPFRKRSRNSSSHSERNLHDSFIEEGVKSRMRQVLRSLDSLMRSFREEIRRLGPEAQGLAKLRRRMMQATEEVVYAYPRLASRKDVVGRLWKRVYYVQIGRFRELLKQAPLQQMRRQQARAQVIRGFDQFLGVALEEYGKFQNRLRRTYLRHLRMCEEQLVRVRRQREEKKKKHQHQQQQQQQQQQFQFQDVLTSLGVAHPKSSSGGPGASSAISDDDDDSDYTNDPELSGLRRRVNFVQGRLHAVTVALGDLCRYRALHCSSSPSHRVELYDTSASYYRTALELMPHNGGGHNQLAVLATYRKDSFGAAYEYYRAIHARKMFALAKDNLGMIFQKVNARRSEPLRGDSSPREAFVVEFLRTQAIFAIRDSVDVLRGRSVVVDLFQAALVCDGNGDSGDSVNGEGLRKGDLMRVVLMLIASSRSTESAGRELHCECVRLALLLMARVGRRVNEVGIDMDVDDMDVVMESEDEDDDEDEGECDEMEMDLGEDGVDGRRRRKKKKNVVGKVELLSSLAVFMRYLEKPQCVSAVSYVDPTSVREFFTALVPVLNRHKQLNRMVGDESLILPEDKDLLGFKCLWDDDEIRSEERRQKMMPGGGGAATVAEDLVLDDEMKGNCVRLGRIVDAAMRFVEGGKFLFYDAMSRTFSDRRFADDDAEKKRVAGAGIQMMMMGNGGIAAAPVSVGGVGVGGRGFVVAARRKKPIVVTDPNGSVVPIVPTMTKRSPTTISTGATSASTTVIVTNPSSGDVVDLTTTSRETKATKATKATKRRSGVVVVTDEFGGAVSVGGRILGTQQGKDEADDDDADVRRLFADPTPPQQPKQQQQEEQTDEPQEPHTLVSMMSFGEEEQEQEESHQQQQQHLDDIGGADAGLMDVDESNPFLSSMFAMMDKDEEEAKAGTREGGTTMSSNDHLRSPSDERVSDVIRSSSSSSAGGGGGSHLQFGTIGDGRQQQQQRNLSSSSSSSSSSSWPFAPTSSSSASSSAFPSYGGAGTAGGGGGTFGSSSTAFGGGGFGGSGWGTGSRGGRGQAFSSRMPPPPPPPPPAATSSGAPVPVPIPTTTTTAGGRGRGSGDRRLVIGDSGVVERPPSWIGVPSSTTTTTTTTQSAAAGSGRTGMGGFAMGGMGGMGMGPYHHPSSSSSSYGGGGGGYGGMRPPAGVGVGGGSSMYQFDSRAFGRTRASGAGQTGMMMGGGGGGMNPFMSRYLAAAPAGGGGGVGVRGSGASGSDANGGAGSGTGGTGRGNGGNGLT